MEKKDIIKLKERVKETIKSTINKFMEHPYCFFTESDIISYFYHRLYLKQYEQQTKDKERIYLVHREYPTNFRYRKKDLLDDSFNMPYDLSKSKRKDIKAKRGNYDLVILDPEFVKKANSKEDIINKSIRLLEIRASNSKGQELLYAIEFKYIINNNHNYIKEIKMDNKKLLFAIQDGGVGEAINLVFCNINYYYIEELKKEIVAASKDIKLIFAHKYYKNNKKFSFMMENQKYLF